MKKLNNYASLFAALALTAASNAAVAQAEAVNNWVNSSGLTWKNGTNELCWRNSSWTPATAAATCDGAIQPAPAPAAPAPAAPAPAPAAPVVVAPPAPVPAAPVSEKVSFSADTFFDFDRAVLKPEGQSILDDLVSKISGVNLEVIIAVGHTDSVGSDAYNQKLSVRRSEAVREYLLSKGIEKNRVYTEGKGEKQPVADNRTKEGRQQNRRVEIEVVGNRIKK